MALLQMAEQYQMNRYLDVPKISTEQCKLYVAQNSIILLRHADMCNIKFVTFLFHDDNVENYYEILKNANMQIKVGGVVLTTLPISLLCNITVPVIRKNMVTICIPDYLMFDIMHISMCLCEIEILFNNILNTVQNIELLVTNTYYDNCKRKEFAMKQLLLPFQQIITHEYNVSSFSDAIHIHDKLIMKGFFIETTVSNINRIRIAFNGMDKIDYDERMIDHFCNKISDGLLYIPFVHNETPNYTLKTKESFMGSPDTTWFECVNFFVKFNDLQKDNKLIIHILGFNSIRYYKGKISDLNMLTQLDNA